MSADPSLERLRADPASGAVLCDIDGTLAPIVADPQAAAVPERTRAALAELAGRYALVGCVSGRRAAQARRMVGLDSIVYAGNHGLELLDPGESEPRPHPALGGRADLAADFVAALDPARLGSVALEIEDKGPIQALHWRRAPDPAAAEAAVAGIAAEAKAAGLTTHRGRMVLELRAVASVDKGVAVRGLLEGTAVNAALFGGDDRTDLDAFTALRELASASALDVAICVGVASEEGPAEIAATADLVVGGTEEFRDLLEML